MNETQQKGNTVTQRTLRWLSEGKWWGMRETVGKGDQEALTPHYKMNEDVFSPHVVSFYLAGLFPGFNRYKSLFNDLSHSDI